LQHLHTDRRTKSTKSTAASPTKFSRKSCKNSTAECQINLYKKKPKYQQAKLPNEQFAKIVNVKLTHFRDMVKV